MVWMCARGYDWSVCVEPTRSLRPHCQRHCCCLERPSLFHCHLTGCLQRPSCKLRHHGLIHQLPLHPLPAPHCSLPPSPLQNLKISCSAASKGTKNKYIGTLQGDFPNCLHKGWNSNMNKSIHTAIDSMQNIPTFLYDIFIGD